MKKNHNVAKIFTLCITVIFLVSSLVSCKDPQPTPEPEPTMYTVTYTSVGGGDSVTGIPESTTVEEDTVLKVADLPNLQAPEGWTFDGWYIGEEPFTADYTVKSNVTITAKFTQNNSQDNSENTDDTPAEEVVRYTVTYVSYTSGLPDDVLPASKTVEEGTVLTLEPIDVSGYSFNGWYLDGESVSSPITVTKDIVLEAKFFPTEEEEIPEYEEEIYPGN